MKVLARKSKYSRWYCIQQIYITLSCLINFYTHCNGYRVPFAYSESNFWQLVLMFILPRVFDMVSNKFFLNSDESLLLQNNQQLPETDSSLILIRSNWDPGVSHYHWPGIFIQLNADLHVTCKKRQEALRAR